MKILLLHGAKCTTNIWNQLYIDAELVELEYPHSLLKNSKSINELTNELVKPIRNEYFDVIIGHSMGGLIALDLLVTHNINTQQLILIESNLKPANEFYRNLLLESNKPKYLDYLMEMFASEDKYYSVELMNSFQEDFDYTHYINGLKVPISLIYGNRGIPEYKNRIDDLCLDDETINQIQCHFVEDACHMPMLENPLDLSKIITSIISTS